MVEYIVNFDLDDPTDTPAVTEPARALFQPITLEELISPDNSLARHMQPVVDECTGYIQQYSARTKKEGERGLTDDLVDARAQGPQSSTYQATARVIDDLVLQWMREANRVIDAAALRWLRARVSDNFLGAGAIEPLRRDKRVTEILVTAYAPHDSTVLDATGRATTVITGGTRVEVQGLGLVDAPGVLFASDDEVLSFIETLMPGNPPNLSKPTQSATLPDGSRVEVAHRIVTDGRNTFMALRRHPETAWTLAALMDNGSLNLEVAQLLAGYVQQRLNMVVAGGTGSGKTSLLNAMCAFIDPRYHVSIIEDTREMRTPPFLYTSRRVARPARGTVEAITIRDHIRAALRSRPDIIMVGEVRGPEALDALKAMNTGHEGSMTTCHANSAHDTVLRLETMISETGEVSESAATHAIASSVDLIVFQSRMPDGSRKVTGVFEVVKPSLDSTHRVDYVSLRPLVTYDRDTRQWVKVGDLSAELRAIRNLGQTPAVVSEDRIRAVAALSGYERV